MDKVRALENLAYQLGVEEGEHVFVCVCVRGGEPYILPIMYYILQSSLPYGWMSGSFFFKNNQLLIYKAYCIN